ncbi:MAG: O-antigen ligase family protein [Acidimicrobiia bacterium]
MTQLLVRIRARRIITNTALLGTALLVGLLYPLSAFRFHPLILPVVVALAALAVASQGRPEVGVAVALVLTSLTEALAGPRPWILGAVWTGLLLAITIVRLVHEGWDDERLPPLCVAAFAVLAVDVIGLVVSGDPAAATPIVRSTATGVALFVVIATQVRTSDQVRWVLGGAVVAAGVVGAHAAVQYFQPGDPSVGFFTSSGELVERVTGGFGHPNQLAGFLLLLFPVVVLVAVLAPRARALAYVVAPLAVFGVYASFSRAALIGLVAIPLVMLRGRGLLMAAPLLAIVLVLAMPDVLRERFATLTANGAEAATRIDFWTTASALSADRPLFGVGVGQFPTAYAEARIAGKHFLPATLFEPPPHAHNLLLNVLAERGLVGLMALGVAFLLAIRYAGRLRGSPDRELSWIGSAVLAAIVAFLIHNMFDVTLFEATAIHFWSILGLLSAVVSAPARHRAGEAVAADPALAARG